MLTVAIPVMLAALELVSAWEVLTQIPAMLMVDLLAASLAFQLPMVVRLEILMPTALVAVSAWAMVKVATAATLVLLAGLIAQVVVKGLAATLMVAIAATQPLGPQL